MHGNKNMIDETFSADSFTRLGLDTDESLELSEMLAQEMKKEMRQVLETKFREIIATLNSMGHNLRLDGETSLGEISYRDDYSDGDGYHCKLRAAFDYVVSTGYAHLWDPPS